MVLAGFCKGCGEGRRAGGLEQASDLESNHSPSLDSALEAAKGSWAGPLSSPLVWQRKQGLHCKKGLHWRKGKSYVRGSTVLLWLKASFPTSICLSSVWGIKINTTVRVCPPSSSEVQVRGWGLGTSFPPPSGSSSWSNTQVDTRQISKRN